MVIAFDCVRIVHDGWVECGACGWTLFGDAARNPWQALRDHTVAEHGRQS